MSTKLQNTALKSFLDLEELVGRNFEKPDLTKLKRQLNGKTVMVTGAGGSIGSEISRQISEMNINKLILVEHSEYNLYKIAEELSCHKDKITLCLASICDQKAMRDLFWKHRPKFIYHAAAYKHVHLVESNPGAGVLNNIHGTHVLLELASEYGVENFTLVSTDKAVRPANIMGATKRICELLVNEYARNHKLNGSSVRFGNVAGSSGSLIPKLFEQITKGRPITITDKRMTRYFMLIPEAVGLVLKASEGARPGSVALLNMGKSVPIVKLAKKLLGMCGKDPETYPIEYVGIRPGEKLFEELSLDAHKLFEDGKQFTCLRNGERDFYSFSFNGRKYEQVSTVAKDLAFYAQNRSPKIVDLVWKAVAADFAEANASESVTNKAKKENKKVAALSLLKAEAA